MFSPYQIPDPYLLDPGMPNCHIRRWNNEKISLESGLYGTLVSGGSGKSFIRMLIFENHVFLLGFVDTASFSYKHCLIFAPLFSMEIHAIVHTVVDLESISL